jgi:hypothetical protein
MKIFFILALGRSGTQFLASLLARSPDALVYHEPMPEDQVYFGLRHTGNFNKVLDGYLERRFRQLLPNDDNYRVYGEVNSFLRCETDWLKNRFDPVLIHLVRDGRDYVRSAYTRAVYTIYDKSRAIVPPDRDPYAGEWDRMNRFQKLCWYWMHTNEFLNSEIRGFVRFEDLIRDYEYFKHSILEPTGLDISYELWKSQRNKPRNTSKRRNLRKRIKQKLYFRKPTEIIRPIPHWSRWDDLKTGQFDEICGETMKKFGYL